MASKAWQGVVRMAATWRPAGAVPALLRRGHAAGMARGWGMGAGRPAFVRTHAASMAHVARAWPALRPLHTSTTAALCSKPVYTSDARQGETTLFSKGGALFIETLFRLTKDTGRDPVFPTNVIFLGGAPGAGKSTHTKTVMRMNGITAPPIITSDLLHSPELQAIKDRGDLVDDGVVLFHLLKEMCKPEYRNGVVIDGFPRKQSQADSVYALFETMTAQHTHDPDQFGAPHFQVAVLYIDAEESVRRQAQRGRENLESRKAGDDSAVLRASDFDDSLSRKRYELFEKETMGPLAAMGERFPMHKIDSSGPIEQTTANIESEYA